MNSLLSLSDSEDEVDGDVAVAFTEHEFVYDIETFQAPAEEQPLEEEEEAEKEDQVANDATATGLATSPKSKEQVATELPSAEEIISDILGGKPPPSPKEEEVKEEEQDDPNSIPNIISNLSIAEQIHYQNSGSSLYQKIHKLQEQVRKQNLEIRELKDDKASSSQLAAGLALKSNDARITAIVAENESKSQELISTLKRDVETLVKAETKDKVDYGRLRPIMTTMIKASLEDQFDAKLDTGFDRLQKRITDHFEFLLNVNPEYRADMEQVGKLGETVKTLTAYLDTVRAEISGAKLDERTEKLFQNVLEQCDKAITKYQKQLKKLQRETTDAILATEERMAEATASVAHDIENQATLFKTDMKKLIKSHLKEYEANVRQKYIKDFEKFTIEVQKWAKEALEAAHAAQGMREQVRELNETMLEQKVFLEDARKAALLVTGQLDKQNGEINATNAAHKEALGLITYNKINIEKLQRLTGKNAEVADTQLKNLYNQQVSNIEQLSKLGKTVAELPRKMQQMTMESEKKQKNDRQRVKAFTDNIQKDLQTKMFEADKHMKGNLTKARDDFNSEWKTAMKDMMDKNKETSQLADKQAKAVAESLDKKFSQALKKQTSEIESAAKRIYKTEMKRFTDDTKELHLEVKELKKILTAQDKNVGLLMSDAMRPTSVEVTSPTERTSSAAAVAAVNSEAKHNKERIKALDSRVAELETALAGSRVGESQVAELQQQLTELRSQLEAQLQTEPEISFNPSVDVVSTETQLVALNPALQSTQWSVNLGETQQQQQQPQQLKLDDAFQQAIKQQLGNALLAYDELRATRDVGLLSKLEELESRLAEQTELCAQQQATIENLQQGQQKLLATSELAGKRLEGLNKQHCATEARVVACLKRLSDAPPAAQLPVTGLTTLKEASEPMSAAKEAMQMESTLLDMDAGMFLEMDPWKKMGYESSFDNIVKAAKSKQPDQSKRPNPAEEFVLPDSARLSEPDGDADARHKEIPQGSDGDVFVGARTGISRRQHDTGFLKLEVREEFADFEDAEEGVVHDEQRFALDAMARATYRARPASVESTRSLSMQCDEDDDYDTLRSRHDLIASANSATRRVQTAPKHDVTQSKRMLALTGRIDSSLDEVEGLLDKLELSRLQQASFSAPANGVVGSEAIIDLRKDLQYLTNKVLKLEVNKPLKELNTKINSIKDNLSCDVINSKKIVLDNEKRMDNMCIHLKELKQKLQQREDKERNAAKLVEQHVIVDQTDSQSSEILSLKQSVVQIQQLITVMHDEIKARLENVPNYNLLKTKFNKIDAVVNRYENLEKSLGPLAALNSYNSGLLSFQEDKIDINALSVQSANYIDENKAATYHRAHHPSVSEDDNRFYRNRSGSYDYSAMPVPLPPVDRTKLRNEIHTLKQTLGYDMDTPQTTVAALLNQRKLVNDLPVSPVKKKLASNNHSESSPSPEDYRQSKSTKNNVRKIERIRAKKSGNLVKNDTLKMLLEQSSRAIDINGNNPALPKANQKVLKHSQSLGHMK